MKAGPQTDCIPELVVLVEVALGVEVVSPFVFVLVGKAGMAVSLLGTFGVLSFTFIRNTPALSLAY